MHNQIQILSQQQEQERKLEVLLPELFVQHLETKLLQLVQRLELKRLVILILLEEVQQNHLQEEMEKQEVLTLEEVLEVVVHGVVLQEAAALEVLHDLQEAVAQEVVDQVDHEVAVLEVLHVAHQEVVELEVVAQEVALLSLNLQVALLERRKTKQKCIS